MRVSIKRALNRIAYCPEAIAPNQCSIARPNSIAALRGVYCKQEYFISVYIHNSPLVGKKFVYFSLNDHP